MQKPSINAEQKTVAEAKHGINSANIAKPKTEQQSIAPTREGRRMAVEPKLVAKPKAAVESSASVAAPVVASNG